MAETLPGAMSFDEFRAFRRETGRWLSVARRIAERHGIPAGSEPEVMKEGSNLIASFQGTGVSRVILKIFPPMLKHQFHSERTALKLVLDRLSVPTPRIEFEGEEEGWPYLGMTHLPGQTGKATWGALEESGKLALLEQIGKLIAEVHALSLRGVDPPEPIWEAFFPRQIQGCVARHERLGLPRKFLDELPKYLEGVDTLFPPSFKPVLLTGEYIPENFMCTDGKLSGLIDFGDAMTGWREYDLIGPGLFMVQGQAARLHALFDGYGITRFERNAKLRKRLMALTLLHRYSDLHAQIAIEGWPDKAHTLAELEMLLWPMG